MTYRRPGWKQIFKYLIVICGLNKAFPCTHFYILDFTWLMMTQAKNVWFVPNSLLSRITYSYPFLVIHIGLICFSIMYSAITRSRFSDSQRSNRCSSVLKIKCTLIQSLNKSPIVVCGLNKAFSCTHFYIVDFTWLGMTQAKNGYSVPFCLLSRIRYSNPVSAKQFFFFFLL